MSLDSLPPAFIPYIDARSAAEVNRRSGSNFFSSFRFLERDRRQALTVVYAFFRIADDCVDELASEAQKRQALEFWAEELRRVYEACPVHPVMRELQEVVRHYALPREHFEGLLQGCATDIGPVRMATVAELEAYCYRVASLVGLVCMRIFGHHTHTSDAAAVNLGLAFQWTNIIRDVGSDLALDRIYLPQDELQRFGVTEADLLARRDTDALFALLESCYARARAYYEAALPEFDQDRNGRLLATQVMTRVYSTILEKIRAEHYPVLQRKVSLSRWEKVRLLAPLAWKGLKWRR